MTVDRDVLRAHIAMADRWREVADSESRLTYCCSCWEPLEAVDLRAGAAICGVCEPSSSVVDE